MAALLHAVVAEIAELDDFLAAAVEDHVADFLRQLLKGRIDAEAIVLGQRLDDLEVVRIAAVPAAHRAAGQTDRGAADDQVGVEKLADAETIAFRARAVRIVEAEHPRLEFLQAVIAIGAGKAGAEQFFLQRGRRLPGFDHGADDRQSLGQRDGGLKGLGQALLEVLPHADAVHDHLDAVFAPQLERRDLVEFVHHAVDPRADETLGAQLLDQLQVLALAAAHHRRQQHQPGAFGQAQHVVHHLADGLRLERNAVVGTAGRAYPGKQQPQVVVDFGDRAHGGARVMRGRVKRQRRLYGARQAGNHDQFVPRQVEVDVGQVVGAGAAYENLVHEAYSGRYPNGLLYSRK